MPKILAIGSPKGGVAKSTSAVTLSTIAARVLGLKTLLVDADRNKTAIDWATRASDQVMPFDVAPGTDFGNLTKLRQQAGYDLIVVDLPGAREGAFKAVLHGKEIKDDGHAEDAADDEYEHLEPVADFVLMPSLAELLDLRPVLRVIRQEVIPIGMPYALLLTRVLTGSVGRALSLAGEQRRKGIRVSGTVLRSYGAAYNLAVERNATVLDLPDSAGKAREAEADMRALAVETFTALQIDTTRMQEA